jgi:prepilin-type N-terminal cleavage/methylation domain-containing protein/prepilin-type processing-associated H-X9-DG protein
MNATTPRRGLTLVELLAVIAIIGLLVGLLMPALQSARESSRRSTCNNNLKTMALASLAHLEQIGTFPSAGWYQGNGGLPGATADNGYGIRQPGGWLFNILSFMDCDSIRQTNSYWARSLLMPSTYLCPAFSASLVNGDAGIGFAKYRISSYSGCAGRTSREHWLCPRTSSTSWGTLAAMTPEQFAEAVKLCEGYPFPTPGNSFVSNGVIAMLGMIRAAHVRDGLSNTYLLGERPVQISTDISVRGGALASGGGTEQENFYDWGSGHIQGMYKVTNLPPEPFRAGVFAGAPGTFGSRHPDTCGMAFCDGSVRNVSFSVDVTVHQGLGTRAGREFVSPE